MTPDPFTLIILGALVGFAVGLTGIGGGSLMTPLLLTLGIPIPVAIGTDLCYAAITKFGGMIAHHKKSNINWSIVLYMALGSIPGVVFSIILLKYASHNHLLYKEVLTYSMGWMLILTALSIFFHKSLGKKHHNTVNSNPYKYTFKKGGCSRYCSCVAIGAAIGVFVTLSSVGAGAIGTAALLFLFPAMLPMRVIGTEIAHAVPLTIIASLGHLYLGNVDFSLLAFLTIGSIPGVFLSASLINKVPVSFLRCILAIMLLSFGFKYVFF